MDFGYFLSGVLSTGGTIALIKTYMDWRRFKYRDRASTSKIRSESIQIDVATMSDGYKGVVSALQMLRNEERKAFEELIEDERKDCEIKMKELRIACSMEIDYLRKQIEQLKTNK